MIKHLLACPRGVAFLAREEAVKGSISSAAADDLLRRAQGLTQPTTRVKIDKRGMFSKLSLAHVQRSDELVNAVISDRLP
jgi:hypothetical protein